MNIPLNDLSRWSEGEIDRLTSLFREICSSGAFMLGKYTRDLERQLSERVAGKSVVCVGNGTDALYLAMAALGVGRGSCVATVANAGGYATGAALRLGSAVELIDIDPLTHQMSVDDLGRKVEQGPITHVVVTHLYGHMAEIADLERICSQRGIFLIEDCAQALGAKSSAGSAGTFGDIATFSFYPTKNLGALGDGGAIVCSTEALSERVRRLAQYGWSSRYSIANEGGINSRIDEIQAAILLDRLGRLDDDNDTRRQIVGRYAAAVSGQRRLIWSDSSSYIGHLAVVVSPTRTSDQENLLENGVSTGIHYPILDHRQPAWSRYFTSVQIPHSEVANTQIYTVPCFPRMSNQEIATVASALTQLG
jgi:aminotransferase EvaB